MNDGFWGKSAAIDLRDCDFEKVSDEGTIRSFFPKIIEQVGMVAHGPVYIDRFGDGELEGWSAMQFIETSSITLHADEFGKRCFIDIFSCKDFDERKALEFAQNYFGAKTSKLTTLNR